jgi:hypothetical protein
MAQIFGLAQMTPPKVSTNNRSADSCDCKTISLLLSHISRSHFGFWILD